MIAASVKDNEKLVELLLSRGSDVNQTSESLPSPSSKDSSYLVCQAYLN